MTPLTNPPLDLDAIEALADAATPGPWCTDSWEIYQGTEYQPGLSLWIGETCRGTGSLEQDRADAAFVAAARTDVPALVGALRLMHAELLHAQQQLRDRSRELHQSRTENGQLRAELAASRVTALPDAVESHVVADDSDAPEHIDDCPGCETGTRPCGHDDYHDPHEWADRPGIWCPGISYADDEPAAAGSAAANEDKR